MDKKTDPLDIKLISDSECKIVWKDGQQSLYPALLLRKNCPCAACRGGHGGKIGAATGQITGPMAFKDYNYVGRYALAFLFSDGHSAGIYSYDFLRDLADENSGGQF